MIRSDAKFGRDFGDYGYHGQFGFYDDGLQSIRPVPAAFYTIAIEKAAPFDVVVYHVPDEVLDAGRALYRRLLDRRRTAAADRKYPGISDAAIPIQLPAWHMEGEGEA